MPTPPAHKRVSFGGTLAQAVGGGTEIFTFSIADRSALAIDVLATQAGNEMHALWAGSQLGLSKDASLTYCVAESVDASGKITGSYRHEMTPIIGDNASGYPTILCNAITLETQTNDGRGRKVRGRIYPPAFASQILGSTSVVEDAEQLASRWAFAINELNSTGMVCCVASTTNGGQLATITDTTCDTIVDTQRRRKNHVTGHRSARHSVA